MSICFCNALVRYNFFLITHAMGTLNFISFFSCIHLIVDNILKCRNGIGIMENTIVVRDGDTILFCLL